MVRRSGQGDVWRVHAHREDGAFGLAELVRITRRSASGTAASTTLGTRG